MHTVRGKRHLSEQQVIEIRRSSEPHKVLGERFDISHKTVAQIRSGVTWWHVRPAKATKRTIDDAIVCVECQATVQVNESHGRKAQTV